jgi:isopropylmalate/homocitrate/citramalate synthase
VSDLIWTGEINDRARFDAQVGFYDTTLRDGEQTVGVVFTPEDKLEIARLLDSLGIERIEAGFARVSEDDWKACSLLANAGLDAEVWGFSRALPADIEAVAEIGMPATVIEAPISDGKLEAFGIEKKKILERITSTIRFAVGEGIKVCFFGVDSTRAAPDFYEKAYLEAVEAGAQEVAVVDTLGIASPEAAAELIGHTIDLVGPDIPIHYHGHNDFGLGTAGAIAAARAGARWIQGTVNGMGERAGNTNIPEVALALQALYGVETRIRMDRVRPVSARVAEMSGYTLEPFKPVVGFNLFWRESGSIASQFHHAPAVEPYSCELVGGDRGIVLGKKSGIASIRVVGERLGLNIPQEIEEELLARVKASGIARRGLVPDEEFVEMVTQLRDR